MQKLQAEVAQLDLKLVAVSDTLAEATVAREDERQVHTSTMKVVSFVCRQTGQSACCPLLKSCALCLTQCNTGSLHRSCLSTLLLQVTSVLPFFIMLYGLLLLQTDGMHICRQQLASVVAGMSSLREKWQIDVQQVEELATVAGMILLDQWSCVPVLHLIESATSGIKHIGWQSHLLTHDAQL